MNQLQWRLMLVVTGGEGTYQVAGFATCKGFGEGVGGTEQGVDPRQHTRRRSKDVGRAVGGVIRGNRRKVGEEEKKT